MVTKLVFVLGLGHAAVQAQNPTDLYKNAPPAVDEAVRARVSGFYQCYVDGKFRQADQFVAEDSKDAFFAAEKQKYQSYEIVRIDYSEEYTRASVVASVGTNFVNRGTAFPVKAPIASTWKLENGVWFWYFDMKKIVKASPFGDFRPGAGDPQAKITFPATFDGRNVLGQVKLSKTQLTLSSFKKSSDQIEILNNLLGTVEIQLASLSAPGLKLSLDKTILKKGEKALIVADYLPPNQSAKETLSVEFMIVTTQERYKLPIVFEIPAEIKSQLPPAAQAPQDPK